MTNLFFCISQFSMNLFTISPNIALEATEKFIQCQRLAQFDSSYVDASHLYTWLVLLPLVSMSAKLPQALPNILEHQNQS